MPGITTWFACFPEPERQASKTRRIQCCQKLKPFLYLLTQLLGKPHNILVMGRACFLRVPVSEANDLNFLLCRCTKTGYASRLGNNETKPMKQIGLNSVTKNRTLIYPSQADLITQRTAADMGMVLGFIWNKEEQGDGADV
jgi:hypothetical protein